LGSAKKPGHLLLKLDIMPSNRPRRHPRSHPRRDDRADARTFHSTGTELCPIPSHRLASVYLAKPTSHPTVYRKRIQRVDGKPDVGHWVSLYHHDSEDGQPQLFAFGLYNPKSEIAVRIVRWSDQLPDETFFDQLIDRAIELRLNTLRLPDVTDCYRVIHAEADGFPGLVVDRYGDCLSAEVFSVAMGMRALPIIERIAAKLGTKHWLVQPSPAIQSQEGYSIGTQSSQELPPHVTVTEHGTKFKVHFGTGHKTGFFCDQREHRLQLAKFSPGRSILDVCCYTGGFAVQAARLGTASDVTGIDLDEEPLKTARGNAALNDVRIKFTQADAFSYMRDMLRQGKQYDIVVLDPPKLIRNRNEIEEGTKKHFDLNRLAMQIVRPGGLMLTCSCAGLLPSEEFSRLVRSAGRSAFGASARDMQFISHGGAAPCHPVSVNCPETDYLKAIWIRL
jgi:23S rRNA (cytosine1962-C5)-methyltransferase